MPARPVIAEGVRPRPEVHPFDSSGAWFSVLFGTQHGVELLPWATRVEPSAFPADLKLAAQTRAGGDFEHSDPVRRPPTSPARPGPALQRSGRRTRSDGLTVPEGLGSAALTTIAGSGRSCRSPRWLLSEVIAQPSRFGDRDPPVSRENRSCLPRPRTPTEFHRSAARGRNHRSKTRSRGPGRCRRNGPCRRCDTR